MRVDSGRFWPAPAKLNLMLRIVGQRSDGYHLLQTVFQFLDVGDRLGFQPRDDARIRRVSKIPGVTESDDLVVKAAKVLQQATGVSTGVDIRLEKKLPMGGGLGGGSSDAATTLVALNLIWDTGLSRHELAKIGLALGADVPVFILGEAAWAEGVGEELIALELPEPWYLVLIPPCHVSTAAIFCDQELTRNSPRMTISDYFAGSALNDCLPVVCRRYPEVAQALEWLGQFGSPKLTGTGACVFTAFDDESEARELLGKLPEGYQGLVARGLNRSPLIARAHEELMRTGA